MKMDDEELKWWNEFNEKKPDENIVDTFESQLSMGCLFYIVGAILLIIWYYVIRIFDL